MSAPELSAEELATVERFDAAPAAEESLRERVARAIFATANPIVEAFPDYWDRVTGGETTRSAYRHQADAAIAVLSGPSSDAERALERVLALADFHTECCEYVKVRDLRAALEGPSC